MNYKVLIKFFIKKLHGRFFTYQSFDFLGHVYNNKKYLINDIIMININDNNNIMLIYVIFTNVEILKL